MKISSRGRYALRLMVDIANRPADEWVNLRDVASRQEISVKYLEQIVTPLSRAGLLLSSRGPQGGYRLSRPAKGYTAGDILRAIEGSLAPVACLEGENRCGRRSFCPTLNFWEGLGRLVNEYVDSVTLEELARREQPADNYSI